MARFVIRRLIWLPVTLLIVTFLVYSRDPHRLGPAGRLHARQPARLTGEA